MRSKDDQTLGLSHGSDRVNQSCTHPDGRNKRSVWTIPSQPYPEAHFATFPPKLIEPCIKAGARAGDTVLDLFMGSGTTLLVARELGCQATGIEINEDYCQLARKRLEQRVIDFK